MKKFKDLINEDQNLNKHDDILVIVDVQKIFGKFIPENFEKKLNKYSGSFKTVYQIWDSNKIDKQSYKFDNEIKSVRKNYGTKFSKELVKFTDQLNIDYPNVKEGDIFQYNNEYVVKVDNNHNWFYVNSGLMSLYDELKNKTLIIVGGADHECIYDVYISMKSFNINPIYNHDYIYSAETSNKQKVNIK